jgi:hypothetical protein
MTLDASLFVSPAVHERKIKLGDGAEHTMHFREIPSGAFRRFQLAETSDDLETRITAPAVLIAAGLCEPDGSDAISVEKAATLKPTVSRAIVAAILDVNGFTGKKGSPSAEATGSATS